MIDEFSLIINKSCFVSMFCIQTERSVFFIIIIIIIRSLTSLKFNVLRIFYVTFFYVRVSNSQTYLMVIYNNPEMKERKKRKKERKKEERKKKERKKEERKKERKKKERKKRKKERKGGMKEGKEE